MLWNEDSFYLKVVFYQATFFAIILQPMPFPNLPTQVLCAGKLSKPVLKYLYICKLHYTSVVQAQFSSVAGHPVQRIRLASMHPLAIGHQVFSSHAPV